MPHRCVVACSRDWVPGLAQRIASSTGWECILLREKEEITFDNLRRLQPAYAFFPHWSWIVSQDVFETFECIIFHMTDVPFGRGGSPLQNLISRGIYETKLTALRCVKEVDAGPIYCKRPLSLHGNAEEIYMRASAEIEEMIITIINEQPIPQPQQGSPVHFARRKPHESSISTLTNLRGIYDFIRMLDAEGYPPAFLENEHLRLEFRRAALRSDHITADVTIRLKKNA